VDDSVGGVMTTLEVKNEKDLVLYVDGIERDWLTKEEAKALLADLEKAVEALYV